LGSLASNHFVKAIGEDCDLGQNFLPPRFPPLQSVLSIVIAAPNRADHTARTQKALKENGMDWVCENSNLLLFQYDPLSKDSVSNIYEDSGIKYREYKVFFIIYSMQATKGLVRSYFNLLVAIPSPL